MSKKNQIMVSQTSPLAGMKPRHCSTRYLEETVLPEYGFRYLYQPGEQHGGQKDGQQTSFGVEIRINCIELYKTQVIVPCIICKMDMIELFYMKN